MNQASKAVQIGVLTAIMAIIPCFSAAGQIADVKISGMDEHTIALWLFDDAPYNNVTLTDAGSLATGFAPEHRLMASRCP